MSELYMRVKDLCEAQGVKVSRMCLDLGMPKSMMSDLNTGRKKSLSVGTLEKIAKYLGVTVSYLTGEEEPQPEQEFAAELQLLRTNPETRTLLNATKGMTADQIQKMTELVLSMKG